MSEPPTHDAIVAQLRSMLALGSTPEQVTDWLKEQGISRAPSRKALERRARTELVAAACSCGDWEHARSVQRLNDLYARALHIQDYKVCLSIEKELRAARAAHADACIASDTETNVSDEQSGESASELPDNVAVMWPGARRG